MPSLHHRMQFYLLRRSSYADDGSIRTMRFYVLYYVVVRLTFVLTSVPEGKYDVSIRR